MTPDSREMSTNSVELPKPFAELRRIYLGDVHWSEWETFHDEYWGPDEIEKEFVYTADQLRQHEQAVRASIAAEIEKLALTKNNQVWFTRSDHLAGLATLRNAAMAVAVEGKAP